MIWQFRKKSQRVVGIHINSLAINLTVLRHTQKQYVLEDCVSVLINKNNNQQALLSQQFISLQEGLQQLRVPVKKAVINLAYVDAICQELEVEANLSSKEVQQKIMSQIAQKIDYPLTEIAVDYQVIEKNNNKLKLEWIAAKRDKVSKLQELISQTHLQLLAVDVDALAFTRLIAENHPIALIQFDQDSISFLVMHSGKRCFIKQERMLIEQPEGLLIAKGIEFVQQTLSIFNVSFQEIRIIKVLLTGYFSIQKNFSHKLEQLIDIPIEIFNPFEDILKANSIQPENPSIFALSCALAKWQPHGG